MRLISSRPTAKGTSIIEVIVGGILLVPIVLFFIDLTAIVLTNEINDHVAKDAARAAASQADQSKATAAAQQTVGNVTKSPIVTDVQIDQVSYDASGGSVSVTTHMDVTMPAPLPGFDKRRFVAKSVEPIVSTPAPM
jgi:hypothetical protein